MINYLEAQKNLHSDDENLLIINLVLIPSCLKHWQGAKQKVSLLAPITMYANRSTHQIRLKAPRKQPLTRALLALQPILGQYLIHCQEEINLFLLHRSYIPRNYVDTRSHLSLVSVYLITPTPINQCELGELVDPGYLTSEHASRNIYTRLAYITVSQDLPAK